MQRYEVAAVAALPHAGLGDQLGVAGERRPRQRSETLVERDVHAVEQPGDLGVRSRS